MLEIFRFIMAQKNNTLKKKNSNINIKNTIMEMFYKHI